MASINRLVSTKSFTVESFSGASISGKLHRHREASRAKNLFTLLAENKRNSRNGKNTFVSKLEAAKVFFRNEGTDDDDDDGDDDDDDDDDDGDDDDDDDDDDGDARADFSPRLS